mgnify:CR=1 FL=1
MPPMPPYPDDVSMFFVTAFKTLIRDLKFVNRLRLLASLTIALTRSCWRDMRPMSDPSPMLLRARARASAWSPRRSRHPAGTFSPEALSFRASGKYMGMPPSSSTMLLKLAKLTTTYPLSLTLVSASTVFIEQAAAVGT